MRSRLSWMIGLTITIVNVINGGLAKLAPNEYYNYITTGIYPIKWEGHGCDLLNNNINYIV